MMDPIKDKPRTIQLDYYSEHECKVVVKPKDHDVFMDSLQNVTTACQLGNKSIKFFEQFRLLLQKLAQWLSQRRGLARHAYITLKEGGFLFIVVRLTAEYNRQFEDDLTKLDIEVATDPELDLVNLEVLALPNGSTDSLRSFLDPDTTMEFSPRAEQD
ncbi:MAG: hypothetical protein WC869_02790 [Phycisphaerae bacterium]|jgi:hypothetical protein